MNACFSAGAEALPPAPHASKPPRPTHLAIACAQDVIATHLRPGELSGRCGWGILLVDSR